MTSLTKSVNGETILLTPQEVAEYESREAAHEAQKLPAAKEAKIKEINSVRNSVLKKPYKWPEPIQGKMREIGVDLLHHLNGALFKDDTYKKPWVCEDDDAGEPGRPIPMLTKEQLIAICNHINARNDLWVVEARRMKNAVMELTTLEEVEAYDVEAGFNLQG